MWPHWAVFTTRSHIGVVTEVMVKEFTVDVASISLAIIIEVTMRGHGKKGHHREMVKVHICPFNREKAGLGATISVWKNRMI